MATKHPINASLLPSKCCTTKLSLGSPADVLIESPRRIRSAIPHGSSTYQIDAGEADKALELDTAYFVKGTWVEFMYALSQRLVTAHTALLESSARDMVARKPIEPEDLAPLLARILQLGLLELGRMRTNCLLNTRSYAADEEIGREHIADLLLAIALIARVANATATAFGTGIVEFRRQDRMVSTYLLVSGRGSHGPLQYRVNFRVADVVSRVCQRHHPARLQRGSWMLPVRRQVRQRMSFLEITEKVPFLAKQRFPFPMSELSEEIQNYVGKSRHKPTTLPMTQTELLVAASDVLQTGGYQIIEAGFPKWNSGSTRLFEDKYNVVGLAVFTTTEQLLDSWPDLQEALVTVISARVGTAEGKAWDGYLVILTTGIAPSTDLELRTFGYDTSRLRKLVATGDDLKTQADVERILRTLLPLQNGTGAIGERTALELLAEQGVPIGKMELLVNSSIVAPC